MAQLNVEIQEDLLKRAKFAAINHDWSLRLLVTAALIEFLDDLERVLDELEPLDA